MNISELEQDYEYEDFYPEIPSTNEWDLKSETVLEAPKINVVKKAVHFDENINPMLKQTRRPITSQKPKPQKLQKPQISYEDILSKMGMFVANGKLHLVDNTQQGKQEQVPIYQQTQQQTQQTQIQRQRQTQKQPQYNYVPEQIAPQNSYIYNKYFKDELTNGPQRPQTVNEYKQMLINQIIQQKLSKLRQTNYRKLVIHNSNINVADGRGGQLNKLFRF